MALKIVFLALLVCCAASEAQSQGNSNSLPLSYNATEVQGGGTTCPNDQLRQETRDNIATDVRTLVQDSVFPQLTMPLPQCPCIAEGTRIAYLDMTDPTQQCPAGWSEISTPVRACARPSDTVGCFSASYPNSNSVEYSRVCGRVIGYQYCTPDAFNGYSTDTSRTIDDLYVDGVSITHGSNPREHVWSFAAAFNEEYSGPGQFTCGCTNTANPFSASYVVPPFVGNDYFCDTGSVVDPRPCTFPDDILTADPLWDGEGCGSNSTCCELNNPPWFCKTLPQPTTDDIEVRICYSETRGQDGVLVEQIEMYVN